MSRPPSVLHVTTFYPPWSFGGDATYVRRLAHAQADRGHHVEVVHCVDAYHLLHPGAPEVTLPDHPRVRRHGLQSRPGFLAPLLAQQTGRPWLRTRQLRAILASRPWDVIHYHNVSLLGPAVLRLAPAAGPAVKLYTAHEHWLVCPMHVLWQDGRRPCETPACLRCTLRAGRPPQLWRWSRLLAETARHVDVFLAPSRFAAAMHGARGFPRPMTHLPLFAERADADASGPRPHAVPYFLVVGRLEVVKGVHTLLDAWARVTEADLVVVGAGTQGAALRARAAGNPRVRFTGAVAAEALGPLYAHALAVIAPSVTYETFGMTLVEAFARRTPAIARDLGALPEIVGESGGGLVYRSEEELRAAVARLARTPALRAELGERGYRAFCERWSPEAHLARYDEILDAAAAARFGHVPWSVDAAS